MMGVYYIHIAIIHFNTFGYKYFISINGYEIINGVYEGLIEVFGINYNNKFIFKANYKKKSSCTKKTLILLFYLVVK